MDDAGQSGTMRNADQARAEPSAPTGEGAYRVLARKYRPSTFADLIGQEAMVRTLSNAFETGRIPQAWILTGVRGVGKTTTARILARALNYESADGAVTRPTIHMPELGLHCQAIMESRHMDVLEMDAASHNGVDDVRQINDAVRYAPVSARYKVYILDEVHMLSGAAFNALLKTLEEPPPHAKFIFATTEIRKVPVTVLSRCQRFDLRRIDAETLIAHLGGIAGKEQVEAQPDALALIARAAEGSVRDALSLLDQGIAHAAGVVRADDVREMLGLADRQRVVDLFEALLRGDIAATLTELRDQYDSGADPAVILSDLAAFTHFVTRVKIVPAVAEDVSLSESERVRGRAFAAQLSMRVLSRTWQMLLKGLAELKDAANPIAAAEMVLVRIAYVADLPSPDEVVKALQNNEGNGGGAPRAATTGASGGGPTARAVSPGSEARFAARAAAPHDMRASAPRGALAQASAPMSVAAADPSQPATPVLHLARFSDLVALASEKRDVALKAALQRDVRLVHFEDGRIDLAFEKTASHTFIGELSAKLLKWTGRRWMISISNEQGAPTLHSQIEAKKEEFREGILAEPLVRSVMERFPGAEIVAVHMADDSACAPAAEADFDGTADEMPDDD